MVLSVGYHLDLCNFNLLKSPKIVTIIISASYLGQCIDKKIPITVNPQKNIIFLLCLIIAGFVEAQPDMGTALIIIGIPTIMYFIAGLSKNGLV